MIEEERPTTFNPQNSNTSYVKPGSNPFAQLANGQNYQQPQIALQPTGFIVPQQTAVPQQPNVFGNFQSQQQFTHRPFSSYLKSQPTGFQQLQPPQTSWFLQSTQQTSLQPQPTRNNPFRQSMFVPQSIGMALFGASHGQSTPNGQSSQGAPASLPGVSAFSSPSSTMPLPAPTPSMGASVKSHQIGTKNPFSPITIIPSPVPKAPILLELTTGMAANGNASQIQQSAEQPLPQQQTGAFNEIFLNNSALNAAADISSLASSFTFNPNTVGSTISDKSSSNNSGFMGSQQTGTTTTGLAYSDSRFPQSNWSPTMPGPHSVSSPATGFGGQNPFLPSSSFEESLMESLLFPGSSPNAVGSTISDKSSSNNSGFMGSQQTGTTSTGSAYSHSRFPQSNKSPTMPGPPSVSSPATGFGGQNPFLPSSSFEESLVESLPFPGSSPNAVGSTISDKLSSNNSGFMGSQQTGTTSTGSAFSDSLFPQSNTSPTMPGPPPVTSHTTGFGGLKLFIPSSSFGASLMESLPFPAFTPTTATSSNAVNGLVTSPSGANQPSSSSSNGSGNYSFLNNQPTGATGGFGGASSKYKSSLDVDLTPQITGGGAANFRASSIGGPNFGPSTSSQSSQPLGANLIGINGTLDLPKRSDFDLVIPDLGADSKDIVSNADVENIPDDTHTRLRNKKKRNRTEFGWQLALQQASITDRSKPEDLEVVASTVVSQADAQTHRAVVGKGKEKDVSDEIFEAQTLKGSVSGREDNSYYNLLLQLPSQKGKEKEEVSDDFFETQSLNGSVSGWEDVLRAQLQEEEELVALSDGYLSQESAWVLSLRQIIEEEEEDNVNNAIASSSSTSYTQLGQKEITSTFLHESDFNPLSSMEGERTLELPTSEFSAETHECGVCNELFGVAQSIQLPICNHSFCRECLCTFTKMKINEGRYPILCPVCAIDRTRVNNSHITQEIVDELELSNQDRAKLFALQLVEHSVVWKCPRCKETMNVDREEYKSERIIICPLPACRRPWCKECLKPLASSDREHNCKQQEFDRLMRKKGWRYCPGCKTPVQKDAGCNHITCPSPGCNVHFCYKCGILIFDASNGGDVGGAITKHYRNCER